MPAFKFGRTSVKIFKFLKYYKEFKKVIDDIETMKIVCDIKNEKYRKLYKYGHGTMTAFHKKEADYAEAQAKAYDKVLKIINDFIKKEE